MKILLALVVLLATSGCGESPTGPASRTALLLVTVDSPTGIPATMTVMQGGRVLAHAEAADCLQVHLVPPQTVYVSARNALGGSGTEVTVVGDVHVSLHVGYVPPLPPDIHDLTTTSCDGPSGIRGAPVQ